MLALIHIEIEYADSVEQFRCRMYRYYEQLRRRHKLAVLPIALYLQVGMNGIGIDVYEEFFEDHRTLRFEYTQLEERFGTLSDKVHLRLDSLSAEQLKQLSRELLKAESLRELGLDA